MSSSSPGPSAAMRTTASTVTVDSHRELRETKFDGGVQGKNRLAGEIVERPGLVLEPLIPKDVVDGLAQCDELLLFEPEACRLAFVVEGEQAEAPLAGLADGFGDDVGERSELTGARHAEIVGESEGSRLSPVTARAEQRGRSENGELFTQTLRLTINSRITN